VATKDEPAAAGVLAVGRRSPKVEAPAGTRPGRAASLVVADKFWLT
jgi:hypothetical protein